jgi:hypothetical protein
MSRVEISLREWLFLGSVLRQDVLPSDRTRALEAKKKDFGWWTKISSEEILTP